MRPEGRYGALLHDLGLAESVRDPSSTSIVRLVKENMRKSRECIVPDLGILMIAEGGGILRLSFGVEERWDGPSALAVIVGSGTQGCTLGWDGGAPLALGNGGG